MSFLRGFFGSGGQPRPATADELNKVFVPLRDGICDFKEETKMSWALICPAVQKLAVRLYIQMRGVEHTRNLFERKVRQFEQESGMRPAQYMSFGDPEIPTDMLPVLTRFNGLIWTIANNMIAKGHPVENVAVACEEFVKMTAAHAGGPLYAGGILISVNKDLQAGKFDN